MSIQCWSDNQTLNPIPHAADRSATDQMTIPTRPSRRSSTKSRLEDRVSGRNAHWLGLGSPSGPTVRANDGTSVDRAIFDLAYSFDRVSHLSTQRIRDRGRYARDCVAVNSLEVWVLSLRRYPKPRLVWDPHLSIGEVILDRLLDLGKESDPIELTQ
jgi:hypothetical protein